MTKLQIGLIGATVIFFFLLYFGCETKPATQIEAEKERIQNADNADLYNLLENAKEQLGTEAYQEVFLLEQEIEQAILDSVRINRLKSLSSKWFQLQQPAIAGHYAQEVAKLEDSAESWAIAGTTFGLCVQRTRGGDVRQYCTDQALTSLEKAIELEPENISHQVNLALIFTENPPSDNPMKGILMLVELNKSQPDNVIVLNTLGRLAIKTGQFDRAKERLERAHNLEPENRNTVCLLAQVYDATGDNGKATTFANQCEQLLKSAQ